MFTFIAVLKMYYLKTFKTIFGGKEITKVKLITREYRKNVMRTQTVIEVKLL